MRASEWRVLALRLWMWDYKIIRYLIFSGNTQTPTCAAFPGKT